MKKKKLKKMISMLAYRVTELEKASNGCQFCENYEPRTVKFTRWEPLPKIQSIGEEQGSSLLEKYLERKRNNERQTKPESGE